MRRLLLLIALTLSIVVPIHGKSLHWSAVDVEAHLDRDGDLRVLERQTIVFDGDWNGGERTFNLRRGQSLTVNRIVRIEDGVEKPLVKGDLGTVDHWDYADRESVIRWRSRMPDDPPFENRAITYLLDVTYRNILVAEGGGEYRLDHDFGFPSRMDNIERFTLSLTFDPIWSDAPPVKLVQRNVLPGEGAPVEQMLVYRGEKPPAGVAWRLPRWAGWIALAAFVCVVAFLAVRFVASEEERGRFAPVVAQRDDELLAIRAEIAGAAWDRSVGPPEVAAVLARMAQEEKIATRVEKKTLHMTLQTNRGALSGYERELVTAMFVNGDSTSTDQIRKHYSSRGFNPAEKIRSGIETKLAALPQWRGTDHSLRVKPHVWSLVVAFLLVGACVFVAMHELDIVFVFLTLFAGGILGGIAAGVARSLSKSVTRGPAGLLIPPLLLLTFAAAPFLVATLNARALDLRPPLLIAQALWLIAWARLIFALLASPDSAEKIAFRKRIAGLREYFREELKKPQPALRDEWYPHLLAFGLGTNVDRWFRAHGGTAESTHGSSWTSSSSSSSSGSSSSSSSWTGGGGAFGGAGASGTWAVAAAGMAAGVSAPSSSSGSGGGGGSSSSSSGGGGGGGW